MGNSSSGKPPTKYQLTWRLRWDYFTSADMRGASNTTLDHRQELTLTSDTYVRRLRATFALYPGGAPSQKELKYETRDAAALDTGSVALSSFAR